jgi:stage II sporulation protein D
VIAILAATAAALAPAIVSPAVTVRILEKEAPAQAAVSRPGERHEIAVRGGGLQLDGVPVAAPAALGPGRWRVEVPGSPPRSYRGVPSFGLVAGHLAILVRMPIDEYVSGVVASETLPGTPFEALKAQAVVVRSYALATRGRHGDADLCDLAHCQVLRGRGPRAHLASATAATKATSGEVLRLASGAIAQAPFHAACGGHTGDPRELFGGDETGAVAAMDPGCPTAAWSAAIPEATYARVARDRLGSDAAAETPGLAGLELRYGAGGYLVQIALGSRRTGGEAFARALDGAMGYGVVRSSRFRTREEGGTVFLSGSGIGHGVGLCQAGATRRAAMGQDYAEILRHYFARAILGKLPMPPGRSAGARERARRTARRHPA